ncbi:hypothetical protein LAZ67_9000327 [Cordylochernes scorpioides]|uniref:Mos1 transposase HTH domain-containing protein n=1 Tax=Cordylochernes scorpioides TaxID=51811 RepID=A0ABY6KSE0_9ARAC|nr:hypothetical protein LAZ67_9000327 [Cordylochernes scorpioides]
MLKQAFKEDVLSHSRTFEWFSRFKAGRTSVKDDLHTGRLLSIRNPENALKIKITIRELSEDLDISFGTCQTIIKNDLHLKRSPAKFVPHLLTNEQKEPRKETCKNMVEMFNSDPHWLKNVITREETWVYGYNPEAKRQSNQGLEPEEPRFKKARMIKSKLKCLLITFFDAKGLVLYEFVPFGRSGTDYSTLTSANRVKCVRGWLFLISQENGLAKYQGPEVEVDLSSLQTDHLELSYRGQGGFEQFKTDDHEVIYRGQEVKVDLSSLKTDDLELSYRGQGGFEQFKTDDLELSYRSQGRLGQFKNG